MNQLPFEVTVELPEDIPPWRKCDLTHQPQRPQRVDRVVIPDGFTLEWIQSGPPTMGRSYLLEPGALLRVRLANNSNEPRRAFVTLRGVEVAP